MQGLSKIFLKQQKSLMMSRTALRKLSGFFCELNFCVFLYKTRIIMAKIELRHLDCTQKKRYAKVDLVELYSKKAILIDIYDLDESNGIQIIFDESTAIRFAKTLRTEINKLKSLL